MAEPGWDPAVASMSPLDMLDALPQAAILTDETGLVLALNHAATELFGWGESEVRGRPLEAVLPIEAGSTNAGTRALASGEAQSGRFAVRHKNGSPLWVMMTHRPVYAGDAVQAMLVVAEDATERLRMRAESDVLARQLSLAVEAASIGTWSWDSETGSVVWDARMETIFGLEPGTFDGTFEAYHAILHPDDASRVMTAVQEAMRSGSRYTVDHRVVWPDGSVHWLQGMGQVTVDSEGRSTGTIGCVIDVTEPVLARQSLEQAVTDAVAAADRERLNAARWALIGRINELLAAAASPEAVMRGVAHELVPELGAWCAVLVLPEADHAAPEVVVHHEENLTVVAEMKTLEALLREQGGEPFGTERALRTGRSVLVERIDEELRPRGADDDIREVLHRLRLHHAMSVPLVKRGRVIGALAFASSDSGRAYDEADLALAEALASRIASTIENRRLQQKQRIIAATLQQHLLPAEVPSIDGLELAVQYWAAGEGVDVGGDFYDAFPVDDHWLIVIGDVCGKGPAAAALTAMVRHTIRTAAWAGASPDSILAQLNHAVRQADHATFCTVLVCELFSTDGGFRLTLTPGGHPLPLWRGADGTSKFAGRPGQLIGAFEAVTTSTTDIELGPGDSLVLYTDGVTDLPPPYGVDDEELIAMADRVGADHTHAASFAEAFGQELADALPFNERTDDIALMVLRATG